MEHLNTCLPIIIAAQEEAEVDSSPAVNSEASLPPPPRRLAHHITQRVLHLELSLLFPQ